MATPSLRLRLEHVGERVEVAVLVPVAGGTAAYGALALDAAGLREVLAELHRQLWHLERAEAVTRATLAARGLAP